MSPLAGQGIRVGIIGAGVTGARIDAAVLRSTSTDAWASLEGKPERSPITERQH